MTATNGTLPDVNELRDRMRGQWGFAIPVICGIDSSYCNGKHGPCFKCGGTDRYRFTDMDGNGSSYCNQCQDGKCGDGISTIRRITGWDFIQAVKAIAEYLRITPHTNGATRNQESKEYRQYASLQFAVESLTGVFGAPPANEWKYHDEHGKLIAVQTRFNLPNGKKEYRPISRHPKGVGAAIKAPDGLRPLYRLPEILDAETICVFEGEKAADAGASIGLSATTSLNGARSPKQTNWQTVNGKHVVIFIDNDEPGREFGETVAGLCHDAGAMSVRIVLLPGLPPKGDIVEWIEAHGDAAEPEALKDELGAIVNATPAWIPPSPSVTPAPLAKSRSNAPRRLETGTRVQCGDRDNFGDVVRDDGGSSVTVHFISPSGVEATRDIPREQLKFEDGRSVIPDHFKLNLIPSREFATADYHLRYLIKHVLVEGQPCIVGGPRKGLKTGTMIDLVVSLGTATPFLNRPEFSVPDRVNVAILSGESGMYTLQETAKRVAFAHKVRLEDAAIWWADQLPQIANPDHLDALRDGIAEHEIKVCVIDPAYLCLLSGDTRGRQASNLFDVGALLMGLVDIGRETGCGIVLAHHTRKNPAEPFAIPELEELAYAGFAEFARQWILLNRRAAYEGGGRHDLWLAIGGSAGHSSTWAYSVEEGVPDEWFRGRFWDVTVTPASDAIEAKQRDRERQKENERHSRLLVDVERILDHLRRSREPQTKKEIRDALGLNSPNFNAAFADIQGRNVVEMTTKKSANRQTYDAYFLSSGHRDTSGQGGSCPDVPMTETHNGTGGYVNSPCPGPVVCHGTG